MEIVYNVLIIVNNVLIIQIVNNVNKILFQEINNVNNVKIGWIIVINVKIIKVAKFVLLNIIQIMVIV